MASRLGHLVAAGPMVLAMLVVGLVGPAAQPGRASVPTACTTPLAGTASQSQAVHAGAPAGVYLWIDQSAWHLRFTHPGHSQSVLTGTVQACTPVRVATYLMQTGDQVVTSADQTAIAVTLYDDGQLDGLEFNASCPTTWTFAFQIDGEPVPPSEIFLGDGTEHPAGSTFALPSCSTSDLGRTAPSTTPIQPLDLASANAGWQVVSLPLRPALIYGDHSASPTLPVSARHRSVGSLLAIAVEIALGGAVLVTWFATRRARRRAT